MTLTQKRKIKNFIATIIADLLIAITTLTIGIIVIKIGSLIAMATHITYEQFRQAMIVISVVGALIAVIKLLKEPRKD